MNMHHDLEQSTRRAPRITRAHWAPRIAAALAVCGATVATLGVAGSASASAPRSNVAHKALQLQPIELGGGVTVTPAKGWRVATRPASTAVRLESADRQVFLFVTIGQAASSDVTAALTSDIHNVKSDQYSKARLTGKIVTQKFSAGMGNFDIVAHVGFTAVGPKGKKVYGQMGELLNNQTGNSAFVVAYSSNAKDYEHDATTVGDMIGSLE